MVNDTFAICANTYIKEANRYSMPNINNAQNRGVALNMANGPMIWFEIHLMYQITLPEKHLLEIHTWRARFLN